MLLTLQGLHPKNHRSKPQVETHEVGSKGNSRERKETKVPGSGTQLNTGHILVAMAVAP